MSVCLEFLATMHWLLLIPLYDHEAMALYVKEDCAACLEVGGVLLRKSKRVEAKPKVHAYSFNDRLQKSRQADTLVVPIGESSGQQLR
jgi:hypothetical protein